MSDCKLTIGKFSIFLLLFVFQSHIGNAQNGVGDSMVIWGTVTDLKKEPIAGASIVVKRRGVFIGSTITDFDGNYSIKLKDTGNVIITTSYVGYMPKTYTGVPVTKEMTTELDIVMNVKTKFFYEPVITICLPLIKKFGSGAIIKGEQIKHLPY